VLKQRQAPLSQPVLLENADGQITASLN